MRVNIMQLSGAALDYAVGDCRRVPGLLWCPPTTAGEKGKVYFSPNPKVPDEAYDLISGNEYNPSQYPDWARHICLCEGISVERGSDLIFPAGDGRDETREPLYIARHGDRRMHGRTPIEAGLRLYVYLKVGDWADVPKELL